MPSESLSAFCARLEALAAKATPGPWISTYETDDPPVGALMGESVIETRAPGISDLERMVVGTTYYDGTRPACCAEDARYLAALYPETVRRLIAAARAGDALARLLGPWADVADATDRGESATTPGLLTFAEQARSALTAWRRATGGEP